MADLPCVNPIGEPGDLACIDGYVHTCVDGAWVPGTETCQPPFITGDATGALFGIAAVGVIAAVAYFLGPK